MNGKCYCGTSKCIGTLFPRIIRDEESGDEAGNEGEAGDGGQEVGSKGKGIEGKVEDAGEGDDMDMNLQSALEGLYFEGHARLAP